MRFALAAYALRQIINIKQRARRAGLVQFVTSQHNNVFSFFWFYLRSSQPHDTEVLR